MTPSNPPNAPKIANTVFVIIIFVLVGTEAPDYYSFSFNLSLPPTFQVLSNAINNLIYKPITSETIDANTCKNNAQISGTKWANTPVQGVGILNVISLSKDWVVQKFYLLFDNTHASIEFQRMFLHGNTWTAWKKVEYK